MHTWTGHVFSLPFCRLRSRGFSFTLSLFLAFHACCLSLSLVYHVSCMSCLICHQFIFHARSFRLLTSISASVHPGLLFSSKTSNLPASVWHYQWTIWVVDTIFSFHLVVYHVYLYICLSKVDIIVILEPTPVRPFLTYTIAIANITCVLVSVLQYNLCT